MRILVLSNSFSGLHSFRKEVFQQFRELGCKPPIQRKVG